VSPHPSHEGRGSSPGHCVWLGESWGSKGSGGGGGMREDKPKSTGMRLMAVLNSALPPR